MLASNASRKIHYAIPNSVGESLLVRKKVWGQWGLFADFEDSFPVWGIWGLWGLCRSPDIRFTLGAGNSHELVPSCGFQLANVVVALALLTAGDTSAKPQSDTRDAAHPSLECKGIKTQSSTRQWHQNRFISPSLQANRRARQVIRSESESTSTSQASCNHEVPSRFRCTRCPDSGLHHHLRGRWPLLNSTIRLWEFESGDQKAFSIFLLISFHKFKRYGSPISSWQWRHLALNYCFPTSFHHLLIRLIVHILFTSRQMKFRKKESDTSMINCRICCSGTAELWIVFRCYFLNTPEWLDQHSTFISRTR